MSCEKFKSIPGVSVNITRLKSHQARRKRISAPQALEALFMVALSAGDLRTRFTTIYAQFCKLKSALDRVLLELKPVSLSLFIGPVVSACSGCLVCRGKTCSPLSLFGSLFSGTVFIYGNKKLWQKCGFSGSVITV